jgi:hypothetical protein
VAVLRGEGDRFGVVLFGGVVRCALSAIRDDVIAFFGGDGSGGIAAPLTGGFGYAVQGPCHLPERAAKVRQINKGKQEASNPEGMDVREQRQQAENGYEFELQFLGFVSDSLGQRVQAEKQNAYAKNRSYDDQGRNCE